MREPPPTHPCLRLAPKHGMLETIGDDATMLSSHHQPTSGCHAKPHAYMPHANDPGTAAASAPAACLCERVRAQS